MHAKLFAALLILPAASCQSMSEGLVSLEGRALVFDDQTVDDFDAATSFDEEDVDVSGFGVQAAVMTPVFDVVGGIDQRDFQEEDAPELSLGLRHRFLEIAIVHPYVEANVRHGFDLDNGVEEEDYDGWNAGLGALVDLGDTWFLNFRLMYESTSIDLPAGGTDVDGVIGTVGIGVRF